MNTALMNDMNLDIRPVYEYHSDERNKLFSFLKKATLKVTILGICMWSPELLLWKNQKASTRYPMILYKWDSTADIFLWVFKFFSDKRISQNSSKPLIVRSFYLFRMSDDCKGNCRNVIGEILQLFWQWSKRNKNICLWVFWKKSQKFLKICREEPALGSFYCKVAPCNNL